MGVFGYYDYAFTTSGTEFHELAGQAILICHFQSVNGHKKFGLAAKWLQKWSETANDTVAEVNDVYTAK